jgi:ABC-type polar amino acid transport system ATPase subunit
MNSRRQIIGLLILVIVLSGVGGFFGGVRYGKMKARQRSRPEAWNVEAMRMLDRKLKLTQEQHEKVQRILDGGVEELVVIRTDALGKTNVVIDRMVGQIDPLLTDEQKAELQRLKEERAQISLDMLHVKPREAAKK